MRLCTISKIHVRQPAPKIVRRERQDVGQRSRCYGIFWRSICAETVIRLETTFNMIFRNLRFTCRTSYNQVMYPQNLKVSLDFHTGVNDVIICAKIQVVIFICSANEFSYFAEYCVDK